MQSNGIQHDYICPNSNFSYFRSFLVILGPFWGQNGKFYKSFPKSAISMTFAIKRYITWPYSAKFKFLVQTGPFWAQKAQIWANEIFFRNRMCSFHEYLSPYRKLLKTVEPFSRKSIFKIRAFWLAESFSGQNSRNNFF